MFVEDSEGHSLCTTLLFAYFFKNVGDTDAYVHFTA